jgi:hypothetical protein
MERARKAYGNVLVHIPILIPFGLSMPYQNDHAWFTHLACVVARCSDGVRSRRVRLHVRECVSTKDQPLVLSSICTYVRAEKASLHQLQLMSDKYEIQELQVGDVVLGPVAWFVVRPRVAESAIAAARSI